MTNLTKLSDAELNKRLADLMYPGAPFQMESGTSNVVIGKRHDLINFCNSWGDIGPVIEELGLHVWRGYTNNLWSACWPGLFAPRVEWQESPTRAATICAIMVLEGER